MRAFLIIIIVIFSACSANLSPSLKSKIAKSENKITDLQVSNLKNQYSSALFGKGKYCPNINKAYQKAYQGKNCSYSGCNSAPPNMIYLQNVKAVQGNGKYAISNYINNRQRISESYRPLQIENTELVLLDNGDGVWTGKIYGNGEQKIYLQFKARNKILENRFMGKVDLNNDDGVPFKFITQAPSDSNWNWTVVTSVG